MAKKKQPKGSGLIAVILVLAFMLTVGVAVLTVTSSGPKVSASMRYQEEAFNAAEAGFDAARMTIEDSIAAGSWGSFADHYLTSPDGIDIPFLNMNLATPNPLYFRRLTDEQILRLLDQNSDGQADNPLQVVFFEEPFVYDRNGNLDLRYRYTVFIIDDEAGFNTTDPKDFLMVCIGVVRSGPQITDRILATCRLEIEIELPEL
ncbi:MAG: pilus assembly PilX N-terminal domain-containing protein [Candidatus Saccharicenans sp.]|nr:pilus assembly PilX N-terminal domain-containing protein [Candidatus Saccharicenans sp.]MDH7574443.1 pilus assembly PilX N-terminal domain-containing protein [Candidatus Saccharicenans sp.]